MRKAKWEPLELSLPRIVKQTQYHLPRGIAEINAIVKELKDVGVVIPTTSAFNSLTWLMHKKDESW